MTYDELKYFMTAYHLGTITRTEMAAAIELWQRRYYR